MNLNGRLTFAAAVFFTAVALLVVALNLSAPPQDRVAKGNGSGKNSERVPPQIRKASNHSAPPLEGSGSESDIGRAEPPPEDPEAKRPVLEEIEEASISYDPKELPVIQRHLLSADPEIRLAARNGMVVLGDAAAAPMLREAAKLAPTSEDTIELLKAADYLELPPARIKVKPQAGGEKKKR